MNKNPETDANRNGKILAIMALAAAMVAVTGCPKKQTAPVNTLPVEDLEVTYCQRLKSTLEITLEGEGPSAATSVARGARSVLVVKACGSPVMVATDDPNIQVNVFETDTERCATATAPAGAIDCSK